MWTQKDRKSLSHIHFLLIQLGTQSKKKKYKNSEYVPISFDPPSSEGYREQKDSEL